VVTLFADIFESMSVSSIKANWKKKKTQSDTCSSGSVVKYVL
jgi:hypothetical protein